MFTAKSNSLVITLTLLSLVACSSTKEEAEVAPAPEVQVEESAQSGAVESADNGTEWVGGGTEIVALPEVVIEAAAELGPQPEGEYFTVKVRHGENLVSIADLADTTVDVIADMNQLDDFDSLAVGQEIYVPIPASDGGTMSDAYVHGFEERRAEARQQRVDRFEQSRGGLAEMRSHRVKTGESAWGLATGDFGVPLWVLSHYNPDVDLGRLRIGQELHYPMLQSALNTERDATERRTRTELAEAEEQKAEEPEASVATEASDSQTAAVGLDPSNSLIRDGDIDYLINDFDMTLPPELDE
jgi:LysM repeat protein